MDNDVTFGEWLRHRRRELDLTQQELAQRVGCGVTTIRKFEAGYAAGVAQVCPSCTVQATYAGASLQKTVHRGINSLPVVVVAEGR